MSTLWMGLVLILIHRKLEAYFFRLLEFTRTVAAPLLRQFQELSNRTTLHQNFLEFYENRLENDDQHFTKKKSYKIKPLQCNFKVDNVMCTEKRFFGWNSVRTNIFAFVLVLSRVYY